MEFGRRNLSSIVPVPTIQKSYYDATHFHHLTLGLLPNSALFIYSRFGGGPWKRFGVWRNEKDGPQKWTVFRLEYR